MFNWGRGQMGVGATRVVVVQEVGIRDNGNHG